MFFIILGLSFLLNGSTVGTAAFEPLLRAAGFSVASRPLPAVDFQLADVTGRVHRLHAQRGNVVFLNFWATWCPPCRREMPTMERLYQALRQRSFVMWAVNMQESREQVERFMTASGLHFPILLDTTGAVMALYQVRGLPTTYVIDCAGNVIGRAMGPRAWFNDAVVRLFAALLNDDACRRFQTSSPTVRAR